MIPQALILMVLRSKICVVDGIRQSSLSLTRDNSNYDFFFLAESPWLPPVHSCVYNAEVFFSPRQWLVPGSIPLEFAIALQLQGYPPNS